MSVKLYQYQLDAIEGLPKNVIMAMDVGLGKTIMALEHTRRYNYEYVAKNTTRVGNIVVVAPASKVRTGDWQREIQNFFGENKPLHEVISYEMFTKKWKELVSSNTTLIIDECHMACNATTKRGKAVIQAARVARQWIMLSATPLPNGWRSAETYSILTGLCRNKTEFVSKFVIIDRSRGFPLILGYREEALLEKWWAGIAKPLERTGDMHLPSQSIGLTPKMDQKTARIYNKALKHRTYHVDGEDELLDSPSKLFTTLRQIPVAARIDSLQNVLEGTGEHVVIWYNFNSERDAILAMLEKSFKTRKVYEQSGHQSKLPPREKWDKLKPSVTLVQYQSGSAAIELTYASLNVYLSPPTSWANYEQSKGRTRRNGQKKHVLFYHIAVEDTLDRHIWGLIKKKKVFSTDLVAKLIENVVA